MNKVTHINFTTGSTVFGHVPKAHQPGHHPSHGAHGAMHNKFHRGFIAGVDGHGHKGHTSSIGSPHTRHATGIGSIHRKTHSTVPGHHSPITHVKTHNQIANHAAAHFKKFTTDVHNAMLANNRKLQLDNSLKTAKDAANRRIMNTSNIFLKKQLPVKHIFARRAPSLAPGKSLPTDNIITDTTLDINVRKIAMGAGSKEISALLAGLQIAEVVQKYLTMKINGKTFTFNVQFRQIDNASDNSTTLIGYTPDKNGNVNVKFQISINAAGAKTPDGKGMEAAKGMHLFHEMHHLVIQTMDIATENGLSGIASPIYIDYKNDLALSKQAVAERGKLSTALAVLMRLDDASTGNVAINKRVNELLDFLVNEKFVSSRTQTAFGEPGSITLIAQQYATNIIKYRTHTAKIPAAFSINQKLPGLIAGFYNAYSN